MNIFWSPKVAQLTPYIAGEQSHEPGIIKLNTNESPYSPSPQVDAFLKTIDSAQLRLYPDPESTALINALAEHHQLPESYFFVGNGSDEVLAHIFMGLFQHNKPLLMPDITYSFYPVYCQLYDIDHQFIALDNGFNIIIQDYEHPSSAVIIANPNAPTGRYLALSELETLLNQDRQRLIVVDEAYIDFGGESAKTLCQQYDNLLVTQTFSKSRALAGMRIGYAIGQPALIEALNRVKNSFNSYPLGRLASGCAIASLHDQAYFQAHCKKTILERERVTQSLSKLSFDVLPSLANFVFCQHRNLSAEQLYQQLRQRKILVRFFNKPRIDNFLRISIGSAEQNDALISALTDILSNT